MSLLSLCNIIYNFYTPPSQFAFISLQQPFPAIPILQQIRHYFAIAAASPPAAAVVSPLQQIIKVADFSLSLQMAKLHVAGIAHLQFAPIQIQFFLMGIKYVAV